jgi:hypothetical protein
MEFPDGKETPISILNKRKDVTATCIKLRKRFWEEIKHLHSLNH